MRRIGCWPPAIRLRSIDAWARLTWNRRSTSEVVNGFFRVLDQLMRRAGRLPLRGACELLAFAGPPGASTFSVIDLPDRRARKTSSGKDMVSLADMGLDANTSNGSAGRGKCEKRRVFRCRNRAVSRRVSFDRSGAVFDRRSWGV